MTENNKMLLSNEKVKIDTTSPYDPEIPLLG